MANHDIENQTLRETAETWLKENKERLAATTYDRYSWVLERVIYPWYGDKPMREVAAMEQGQPLSELSGYAAKNGYELTDSTRRLAGTLLNCLIGYVKSNGTKTVIPYTASPYEALSQEEIEQICIRAKYNHCPEMLAALLSLYCGLRLGEICALTGDAVDLERLEIDVHATTHRVRNPDQEKGSRTTVVIEELPQKTQLRRVSIPSVMKAYLSEFHVPGRLLLRGRDDATPMDTRTLEGRLHRFLGTFGLETINFERLRKTYRDGKADAQILERVLLGKYSMTPNSGVLDVRWLTDEMTRDLAPLRLLIGLSAEEMSGMVGVSEEVYRNIEAGYRSLSWDQYLTLLFLFHYNARTARIVEHLGLFPESLKSGLKIGG